MKTKEILKRYGLFVISLWFSALGVAFAKCGNLGVSPLSSVPNVLSLRFTGLTMGEWLILWSVLLIAAVGRIGVMAAGYMGSIPLMILCAIIELKLKANRIHQIQSSLKTINQK